MSHFVLVLRVDAPAPGGYTTGDVLTDASQKLRTSIYRKLGLEVHSNAWVTIKLNVAKGRETLRQLLEECRVEGAVVGAGTVTEQFMDEDIAAADWFYLVTKTAGDSFSLWDDYPCYKPGTLPDGQVLNHAFVSAAFVEVCGRLGLTGLSFLRCRNAGRKRSAGWFVALPDRFLGHGLDHPWFDRDRWVRDVAAHPGMRSSSLQAAQYSFHDRWLRDDLGRDDQLVTTLPRLLPIPARDSSLTGLTFVTIPRYWTRTLPDTDFAYIPWGEDGPNRVGKVLRFRQLVVSGRARAGLMDARLLGAKVFLPVRSVARPEPGVALLDELYPPVSPMYTAEELAELRRREKMLAS